MPLSTTDNSERGFQKLIVKELIEKQNYVEAVSTDFDKEFCVNKKQLFQFIENSQPKSWQLIQKKGERNFLLRLDKKLREKGIIETLRKGVKFFDKTVETFYPQPVSNFNENDLKRYNKNIFSVTQELKYTTDNENRIDLVIFLNGLPVITLELKNAFTHQAVKNAIRQYQASRNPKDKIFNFARCMVHFAADTDLVYMTTELKGQNTFFLPFNKGLNDGKPIKPFGAGNPVNPSGLKTAYLWEEVLTKASLSNIIEKFAQVVSEDDDPCNKKLGIKTRGKKKLIFPRYHQLSSVRQLLKHTKKNGVGNRYLIQHSAGSGKSNSIAWLAHQLANLYDVSNTSHLFDSIIVVTDRTVLDRQIRETIKKFAHVEKVVAAITGSGESKTGQLKEALANHKKIIIVTVQTFPFLLNEMDDLQDCNFGIIIDEAHSSQSGESAAKMNAVLASKNVDDLPRDAEGNISTEDLVNHIIESRKMLQNASYYAFTATPKNKTLETFGVPEKYTDENGEEKNRFNPFHTYSMKQAIEEEFILDVLGYYTTYNSFYKLRKDVEDNPEYETKEANKKLRAYVEGQEFAITQKAKIMIEHFHRDVHHLINGNAKAMVVTKSIEAAMKYKDAFDAYLKEINSPYKAIVAFSGKKKHYKTGVELSEADMNNFPDGDNDIPCQFRRNEYRFLIVAEKYQTGFDQPLLHTMYVDKQLSGIAAVQTLSRLNRSYKPYKKDTFVLDFYNSEEDIQLAFQDYYTTTLLSQETDSNKLNDLEEGLADYQVYSEEDVKRYFELYYSNAERSATDPIIDKAAAYFDSELSQEEKVDFKSKAKSFVRTYSYLAKLLDFNNAMWEMLWLFLKYLIPKLHIDDETDEENILEAVNMDSYRVSKQQSSKINLVEEPASVEPIPVSEGGGLRENHYDNLENIINEFNHRFGDIEWTDADKVNKILTQEIPEQLGIDASILETIKNSDKQNAKVSMDKRLFDLMQGLMFSHTEIYKKFVDDPDFKNRYQDFIFDIMWEKGRKAG
jgi:type I restriction enzyme, R subunit